MSFWKLLASLWPWGESDADRRRKPRRAPAVDSLNEIDALEDRATRTTLLNSADVSDRARPAEVLHTTAGQRMRQVTRQQSKYFRLIVVVVDYLLEHEWYYLLTGQHKPQSGVKHGHGRSRDKARQTTSEAAPDPFDESSRTTCASDSSWSIVAAIDHDPPNGSTTTETE